MREMKESGIEYLNQIPKNWSRRKYKNVANSRMGETILKSDTSDTGVPIYSATSDNKIFGYLKKPKVILKKGDIVIPARGTIGKATYIEDEFATCTQTTIGSYNFKCNSKYLYYCVIALNEQWFHSEKTSVPLITIEQLNNVWIPFPNNNEQYKIVKFLDKKIAEIDNIIEKTKNTIEDYKKYSESIINEAVTQGICKNIDLCDTSCEFIKKLPIGWKTIQFKHIANVMANLVNVKDYQDYPQIAPDNIEKNTGRLLDYNSVRDSGVISDNHLFYKGQIIYSKIRPKLNKAIIAPFDGLCSADMYPIETRENTNFLLYSMLSQYFVSQVTMLTEDRVKMPKINKEELGTIMIALPKIDEQKDIVEYIDKKCGEINDIIANKEKLIEDLEQYKKSLIYEYVTGKKEVV